MGSRFTFTEEAETQLVEILDHLNSLGKRADLVRCGAQQRSGALVAALPELAVPA